jgi:hypothetical protein
LSWYCWKQARQKYFGHCPTHFLSQG